MSRLFVYLQYCTSVCECRYTVLDDVSPSGSPVMSSMEQLSSASSAVAGMTPTSVVVSTTGITPAKEGASTGAIVSGVAVGMAATIVVVGGVYYSQYVLMFLVRALFLYISFFLTLPW